MSTPRTGRRSSVFDHADPAWGWHLVLRRARQGRRPALGRGEGIRDRHGGASLRRAEVHVNKSGTPVWSHDGIICTGESYKGEGLVTSLAKRVAGQYDGWSRQPGKRLSAHERHPELGTIGRSSREERGAPARGRDAGADLVRCRGALGR